MKSETPAAFNIVTALWRKLWNEQRIRNSEGPRYHVAKGALLD
jgi:hypothetical protein